MYTDTPPPSNSWWINIEFGEKKIVLRSSMSLSKQIGNLELQRHILERDHLILNCRPNVEAVNANMFGELMLHQILSNTDGACTVQCTGVGEERETPKSASSH